MLIRLDERKVHTSIKNMDRLDEFQVILLPRPPYSSDISSSDFSSFRWSQDAMRDQQSQVLEAV
jgi:hypothetical protein